MFGSCDTKISSPRVLVMFLSFPGNKLCVFPAFVYESV